MPDEPLSTHDLFLEQLVNKAKEQFSKPPISDDDQGDLAFAITTDEKHGVVRLRFAKPVVWLAMEPDMARTFCNAILERVNQLENMQAQPQESNHEHS